MMGRRKQGATMTADHFIPLWIIFAFAATVGISTFL